MGHDSSHRPWDFGEFSTHIPNTMESTCKIFHVKYHGVLSQHMVLDIPCTFHVLHILRWELKWNRSLAATESMFWRYGLKSGGPGNVYARFFPSAAGALPKENKRRAGSMRVNGCWYMFVYPCFGVSQFHPRFRIYQEWCSDTGFHFYQFRDDIGESFWVPRSLVCQFVAHLWHGFGMFWSHLWLLKWFIHRNVQSCSNL